MDVVFVINSILLGAGLAMDAFSVSLANGMNEPQMRPGRMSGIAGVYAFFQFLMPMTGWICVHTIAQAFHRFEALIPWIALILLSYIGGKMLLEGIRGQKNAAGEKERQVLLGVRVLILQGIATSIDALSVGFAIADYEWASAFTASLIIAAVTFLICMAGLRLGKIFGTKLSGRASIFGGLILIAIGIEIFCKGLG